MSVRSRTRGLIIVLAVIVIALVALRVAAPTLVTRHLNGALADLDEYRGHVDDVDLAIWRGAATVHGLIVEKVDSEIDAPLLSVPRADVSVQWDALLEGDLVGEASLDSPSVHFVQQEDETQYGDEVDWQAKIEELTPVRLNRVSVSDGSVHFQNPTADPPVDIFISELELSVDNLTNIRESDAPVYTSLQASATAMDHAPVSLNARLDPLQDQPQFDLDFEMQELELTRLNDFLESYVNITAEAGTLSVSGEVAAADGAYEGYVKPLLDHAEFLDPEDFKERPLGAIWETVVAAFAEIFENQPRDRLGTRVPISGEFGPEPDVIAAIGGVFRNMFDAFLQGVEGSVDLRDAMEEAEE